MNIEQVAALYEADGFPEVADIIRRTPSDELLRRLRHYWMPPNNDDADNLVEKSGRKLTVPAGAITKDAKGAYVFREDDVGEYSVRRVKVGDEVEDGIAIAPGVRLVASDDDDDDDDYDNYDNYDDDAPAPRRYVQDIGGEGRPLRSGQTVIDWDVSWTNPEQIRRWWRHYALLEEALRPPTLEEAAAGLIVALGGDRRERRAAVEALDAALAALPAAARAEATARYGLAADDRAALLADVADLEAVVEHVWGQPEEDPRGRAPDGIQARVPVALFVGTLDAEATINALEARGFGRLARQFRLLVAIGRGERFEDPDLVSLQRALEARGVLVRSYPGFSVPERRAEWVITPGLSLFARGRYYGSGPLEALTWYGRTLHLLGYPEPEPALSAVFGVGRTRWMPAAERARLVEGLKRRKADVDAEVAQQWADTDGEVGLPPVSAKVRALIEVMSEAGLAGRLLERHGVARTQWEAHARPPAQRPTGAALRRLAADLPPELGDGIALASELIAAADVADAHANEVIEAQPTAAEILGDLDKFETTPTQIAASFRERDATAHLASRIEELVEEGTVGASAALLVDIRGSWVERQRKVGYRVRSLSITAQRWTSQRAVDVRALEGQAPSGLFGGEAVTVLRLNDKGPVEHQGVELRSVRPLEHVHGSMLAPLAGDKILRNDERQFVTFFDVSDGRKLSEGEVLANTDDLAGIIHQWELFHGLVEAWRRSPPELEPSRAVLISAARLTDAAKCTAAAREAALGALAAAVREHRVAAAASFAKSRVPDETKGPPPPYRARWTTPPPDPDLERLVRVARHRARVAHALAEVCAAGQMALRLPVSFEVAPTSDPDDVLDELLPAG